MKTVTEIMLAIIRGVMPRTTTGALMELLAFTMAYEGRC